jgi:hypothetical protein
MQFDGGLNPARLKLAREYLQRGHLAAADILCRNVLDNESRNAGAYAVLGRIAGALAQHAKAQEYFSKATEFGSTDVPASGQAPPVGPRLSDARRYLLIKAWGHGFWSEVSHVLGGLLLAQIEGRIPVVHWGRNFRFSDTGAGAAFGDFFAPLSPVVADDLTHLEGGTFFPPRWTPGNLLAEPATDYTGNVSRLGAINFLGRPETVVVAESYLSLVELWPWIPPDHPLARFPLIELCRHLIQAHLRPVPAVLAETEAFHRTALGGGPFVAVHLRGSDKFLEQPDLQKTIDTAFDIAATLEPSAPLFLLTDDQRVLGRALRRFGNRLAMTTARRTDSDVGIHFAQAANGRQLGNEIMKDVYIALRATTFLGLGASNVSAMIALMRQWPPNACQLLGYPTLLRRNRFLYLPPEHVGLGIPDH